MTITPNKQTEKKKIYNNFGKSTIVQLDKEKNFRPKLYFCHDHTQYHHQQPPPLAYCSIMIYETLNRLLPLFVQERYVIILQQI